jgi:adenylate cyclase
MRPITWWRARRARLLQLWAVGMVASLLVTAASSLGYFETWQARALDLIQWFQGQKFKSDVVIVAIDQDAFQALGSRTPISRKYLARVVDGLRRSGAAVVGIDFEYTSPTTIADDTALVEAIERFGDHGVSRVVLGDVTSDVGVLADPRLLKSVVRGSPAVPREEDGLIRKASYVIASSKRVLEPALSLAIVARLAGMDQQALAVAVASGSIDLPVWSSEPSGAAGRATPFPLDPTFMRINFAGPAATFLTIPSDAVAALGDAQLEVARDNPLRDRVVLIGATYKDSRDAFWTPVGQLPGVEVHATLVHMLMTRSLIQPTGWIGSLGSQMIVVGLAGVVLTLVRPLVGTLICVVGGLPLGVLASYYAFKRGGYWIDFLLPVLATTALGVGADILSRRRFRESFGRYVSPQVAAQILAEEPSLNGERREVSILISDLRGFTTLSENMEPVRLTTHLNEYFEAMTAAIFVHRGMVNDFVGDSIIAVFGAPLADPDHALHAVQSAIGMDQALEKLNARWETARLPTLRQGVGIHTGIVYAGNVGASSRMKYTVIGDAVNVAARLEGLNKDLGTTILITEETRAILKHRVDVKDRGAIPVKGRVQPVRVFEVVAVNADGDQPPRGG